MPNRQAGTLLHCAPAGTAWRCVSDVSNYGTFEGPSSGGDEVLAAVPYPTNTNRPACVEVENSSQGPSSVGSRSTRNLTRRAPRLTPATRPRQGARPRWRATFRRTFRSTEMTAGTVVLTRVAHLTDNNQHAIPPSWSDPPRRRVVHVLSGVSGDARGSPRPVSRDER